MTSLNPLHTIEKQISEVLFVHQGLSRAAARTRTRTSPRVGGIREPEKRLGAYPHELSGGQRQRVMIAMALANDPELLIADEPTTALDVTIQAQVLCLMRKLHRKNSGLLLITHDMGVVSQMATRIAVMYAGQIVEQADAAAFFARPLHPYSIALLEAMPSAATRGRRLKAIPGQVPSAGNYPGGCRFHDRCPVARPDCARTPPELLPHGDRLVRCPYCEAPHDAGVPLGR
jgi:oligopeptide/dipeptide ABC transporter ATP-binding protein